jgi:hypothetical protein
MDWLHFGIARSSAKPEVHEHRILLDTEDKKFQDLECLEEDIPVRE